MRTIPAALLALACMGASCDPGVPIEDFAGPLGTLHDCPPMPEAAESLAWLAVDVHRKTGHEVEDVRAVLAQIDHYCMPAEEQDTACADYLRDNDSIGCATYRIDVGPRTWLDVSKASPSLLVHESTHLVLWVLDRDPDYEHARSGLWD